MVNQKIALAILKKHIGSSAIAVASDGVEAVEQAKKRHFDCILMVRTSREQVVLRLFPMTSSCI